MTSPFHAYDIRGLVDYEINGDLAYKVARAYCKLFSPESIAVGYDMRESSPEIADALITGLQAENVKVFEIGLCTTDMLYLSVILNQFHGGFMVTASHNPAQYNGIKIVGKNATPLGMGLGLEKIEKVVKSNPSFAKPVFKSAKTKIDFKEKYINFIFDYEGVANIEKQTIAIDCGNGMGGFVLPEIIEKLPVKSKNLFFELDGNFPNHEANPLLQKNRIELEKIVKNSDCSMGVGFDGDCDRAFFVDGDGDFISADFILGILSEWILKKIPGSPIAFDVRCSNFVEQQIKKFGGTPLMGRVGHAYAKNLMKQHNSPFGGEVAGHYYFKYLNNWFDSGPLIFLVLLDFIGKKHKTLKEISKITKNYFTSGEINMKVENPQMVLEKIREKYSNTGKMITIDGIRVETKNWWFSVRKSNTEPLFRLNCEGNSKETLTEIQSELTDFIMQFQ
jgi:phosphomannomutase